jgi:hypothetical protein
MHPATGQTLHWLICSQVSEVAKKSQSKENNICHGKWHDESCLGSIFDVTLPGPWYCGPSEPLEATIEREREREREKTAPHIMMLWKHKPPDQGDAL